MGQYYRHGDIGISPLKELPSNLKTLKTNVLAYGEQTGHKHQLLEKTENQFDILEDEKGQMYLNIKQPTDLVHEEHKTITIEKGLYFISHEREYDYATEELKRVAD
jgi:hypothetical protein